MKRSSVVGDANKRSDKGKNAKRSRVNDSDAIATVWAQCLTFRLNVDEERSNLILNPISRRKVLYSFGIPCQRRDKVGNGQYLKDTTLPVNAEYISFRSADRALPRACSGALNLCSADASLEFDRKPLPVGKHWVLTCWFDYQRAGQTSWKSLASGKPFKNNKAMKHLHFTIFGSRTECFPGVYVPDNHEWGEFFPFQKPMAPKGDEEYAFVEVNLHSMTNGWHHLAVVGDVVLGQTRLYLDGEFRGVTGGVCDTPICRLGNSKPRMGKGTDEHPFYRFADVRIYDLTDKIHPPGAPLATSDGPSVEDLKRVQPKESNMVHALYSKYGTKSEVVYDKAPTPEVSSSQQTVQSTTLRKVKRESNDTEAPKQSKTTAKSRDQVEGQGHSKSESIDDAGSVAASATTGDDDDYVVETDSSDENEVENRGKVVPIRNKRTSNRGKDATNPDKDATNPDKDASTLDKGPKDATNPDKDTTNPDKDHSNRDNGTSTSDKGPKDATNLDKDPSTSDTGPKDATNLDRDPSNQHNDTSNRDKDPHKPQETGKDEWTLNVHPCKMNAYHCDYCSRTKIVAKAFSRGASFKVAVQSSNKPNYLNIAAVSSIQKPKSSFESVLEMNRMNLSRVVVLVSDFLLACGIQKCIPFNKVLVECVRERDAAKARYPSNFLLSVLYTVGSGKWRRMYNYLQNTDYLCARWLELYHSRDAENKLKKLGLSKQQIPVVILNLAREYCSMFRREVRDILCLHVADRCECSAIAEKPHAAFCVLKTLDLMDATKALMGASFPKPPFRDNSATGRVSLHSREKAFYDNLLWHSYPCIVCAKNFRDGKERVLRCEAANCSNRFHVGCVKESLRPDADPHFLFVCPVCEPSKRLAHAASIGHVAEVIHLFRDGASPLWSCGKRPLCATSNKNPWLGGLNAIQIAASRNDLVMLNILLHPYLEETKNVCKVPHPQHPEVSYYRLPHHLMTRHLPNQSKSGLDIAIERGSVECALQLCQRTQPGMDLIMTPPVAASNPLIVTPHVVCVDQRIAEMQTTGNLPEANLPKTISRDDVSNGGERIPIPWKNTVNSETPHRGYVVMPIEHASVLVDWSTIPMKGCHCGTSCNLDDEYASGSCATVHVAAGGCRSECGPFCSCSILNPTMQHPVGRFRIPYTLNCGRRCVQQGSIHDLSVFQSEDGRGWGVRAGSYIRKGSFVCEYVGEIISEAESEIRERSQTEIYAWDMSAGMVVDGFRVRGIAAYVNHRCSHANLKVKYAFSRYHEDRAARSVAFYAARHIHPGEELTCDYKQGAQSSRKGAMMFEECLCGSCSGV